MHRRALGHAKKRQRAVYVSQGGGGIVGEYNATTGAAINANFITGVSDPDQTRRAF